MADKNQPINLSKEEDEVPFVLDQSTGLPRPPNRLGRPWLQAATMPEKRSWPELEGLTAEEAEKKIKGDMPTAEVQIIPQGSGYTQDFRFNRVRIFVDSSSKVIGVPDIG